VGAAVLCQVGVTDVGGRTLGGTTGGSRRSDDRQRLGARPLVERGYASKSVIVAGSVGRVSMLPCGVTFSDRPGWPSSCSWRLLLLVDGAGLHAPGAHVRLKAGHRVASATASASSEPSSTHGDRLGRDLTAPSRRGACSPDPGPVASRSPRSCACPRRLHRRRPFDLEQKVRVEQPLTTIKVLAAAHPENLAAGLRDAESPRSLVMYS